MSAPVPPPDQPVRPPACGHCGDSQVEPHCGHPRCPWSACTLCHHITGFVLGRVRTMVTATTYGAQARRGDGTRATVNAAEDAAVAAAKRLLRKRQQGT